MVLRRGAILCLVAIYLLYIWSIRGVFVEVIQGLRGTQVLAVSCLLVVHWWLRAQRDRLLFGAEGHVLRISDLLWLNSTQLALNYLPLKAGTFSAAGFLLTRFRVSIRGYAVVTVQQYLLNALAAASLGAAAVWGSSARTTENAAIASACFLGIALASLGLLTVPVPIGILPKPLAEKLSGVDPGRLAMLRKPSTRATVTLGLTVAVCIASALRMSVVFGIVTPGVGTSDALVISALVMLSPIVAITPAGLGITEALVGLAAVLVGQPGQVGVVAATIDRAVVLVLAAIVWVASAPFTWRPRREA
jgi:uncharacterized membrane protein YbhN (UPF0104 family)